MNTQTQRARTPLERMAGDLEDTAAALRAVLDGTAQDYHHHTLEAHMTGDRYGLIFNGFDNVRCPSCGAMDWTLGTGDTEEGLCPSCAGSIQDERDAEDGFSQRAYEDHLQEMADYAAEGDDY